MPDELDTIIIGIIMSTIAKQGKAGVETGEIIAEARPRLNALFLSQALDLINNCEVPVPVELIRAFQAKYGGSENG